MSSDPIADTLTIIRNGYLARATAVNFPRSKFKEEIVKVLAKSGYLQSYKVVSGKIEVVLKYEGKKGAIEGIKKVSRPGLKIYRSKNKIPKVLSGFGTAIVSTSKGVMTGNQAKKLGLGGEVICEVW